MSEIEESWPGNAYIDDAVALLSTLRDDAGLLQKLQKSTTRRRGSTLFTLYDLIEGFSDLLKDPSEVVDGDDSGDEEGAKGSLSISDMDSKQGCRGSRRAEDHDDDEMEVQENEEEEEKGGANEDEDEEDRRVAGSKRRRGGTTQDAKHYDDEEDDSDSDLECVSVIIIGASASGLGVASALLSTSPDLDVTILESSSDVGAR